jgi:hypothetical protein
MSWRRPQTCLLVNLANEDHRPGPLERQSLTTCNTCTKNQRPAVHVPLTIGRDPLQGSVSYMREAALACVHKVILNDTVYCRVHHSHGTYTDIRTVHVYTGGHRIHNWRSGNVGRLLLHAVQHADRAVDHSVHDWLLPLRSSDAYRPLRC